MNGSKRIPAPYFPTGYPKAPVRVPIPKYIGGSILKESKKISRNCVDFVRVERNIYVSGGDETRDLKGERK